VNVPYRTADPYRDLDVIDARAPRFNQLAVGLGSLLALVTGWWLILALLAAQLAIGLWFGRQYCLPCLAYFELIQPRLGEGPIEDARPPRFANKIGLVVLTAAALSYAVGLGLVGAVLAGAVAGLALLAAATGFCAGCQVYRLGAHLLGVRLRQLDTIDLAEVGLTALPGGEVVVAFGHPLCTDCHAFEAEMRAAGREVVVVDVRAHRRLARKYGIALVPTAVAVAPDGRVTARLAG